MENHVHRSARLGTQVLVKENWYKTARRLRWVRVGDHYADLAGEADHFIALDDEGQEIGVVKFVAIGTAAGSWMWSMRLTHPSPTFTRPTNGLTPTRKEAARELLECWRAFREWFGIED